MKINWGTSIVIAFASFMLFILFFVFKVQSNSKYDNELVVEEYYKHDANYQQELAKLQNGADLKQKPTFTKTADGIEITFPKAFDTNNKYQVMCPFIDRPTKNLILKYPFQSQVPLYSYLTKGWWAVFGTLPSTGNTITPIIFQKKQSISKCFILPSFSDLLAACIASECAVPLL